MIVIQPRLAVPPDIAAGLATGAFVRNGSVVRDLAGQIVKHLDEAPPAPDAQRVSQQLPQGSVGRLNLSNRTAVVVLTVGVVAAVVAGVTAWRWHSARSADDDVPQSVRDYRAAWGTYIEAASLGRLDADVVARLMSAYDGLCDGSEGISIVLSPEQSKTLIAIVAEHTRNLAAAAGVELTELKVDPTPSGGAAVDIRKYLAIQERILRASA